MMYDLIIIGAGAAGIFSALIAKETNINSKILVIEQSDKVLSKVLVSGGGRCNITNNCQDPKILTQNYPRGSKELIGPFHQFNPKDMINWLQSKGVELKVESDGRMFPITDNSKTIIDCFLNEFRQLKNELLLKTKIQKIINQKDKFTLELQDGETISCKKLILATGSSLEGYRYAKELGHSIQKPIASLFAFIVQSDFITDLSGVSQNPVILKIKNTSFSQNGSLLFTHFGLSGPVVLHLSAWAARYLYEKNYRAELIINWLPGCSEEEVFLKLINLKKQYPNKTLLSLNPFKFSSKLWRGLISKFNKSLAHISNKDIKDLCHKLLSDEYLITGKTTNKKEFVTCGGVSLKEVDFKTMQSKICPNLYFAGEILDIDGVTGGFNFQNAWTTGFIAAISSMR